MKLLHYVKDNPTLSLAILSAYLYLCTSEYESSYLQEFNISNNFLTLDVNTILKDGSRIIGLGLGIIALDAFLSMLFSSFLKKRTIFAFMLRLVNKLIVVCTLMWIAFP